jgi:hypothetical protein
MKLLDKLVLNRLVSIVLNFIITLIKILSPKIDQQLGDKSPAKKSTRWRPKTSLSDRLKPKKLEEKNNE